MVAFGFFFVTIFRFTNGKANDNDGDPKISVCVIDGLGVSIKFIFVV